MLNQDYKLSLLEEEELGEGEAEEKVAPLDPLAAEEDGEGTQQPKEEEPGM